MSGEFVGKCEVNEYSSRVCEVGTRGCNIYHSFKTMAELEQQLADLQKELADEKIHSATSDFCSSEWKHDLDKLKLNNLKNAIVGDCELERTKRIWNAEIQDYAKTVEHLRKEIADLKKENATHNWYCGCGHWNGANLATCAMCGRTPSESYPNKS